MERPVSPVSQRSTKSSSHLEDLKSDDSTVPVTDMHSDPEKGDDVAKTPAQDVWVRPHQGWRFALVYICCMSTAFLYGLDNTIVADIQAPVVERFNEVEKVGWLGIGFGLGSVAVILPFGKAYGIWDVKWLYIGSTLMFEAGSALCGGAPNMNALIVGRVWAGVGAAGMYLGCLNTVSINTTEREKPVYMASLGLMWGVGAILGPVIGGAFADSDATWRWVRDTFFFFLRWNDC